jgi:uncharacterized membrane protein YfcA
MSELTIVGLVAFVGFAALSQTLTGFGFALMAMPLVTFVLGVRTAAPLVALMGLTLYTINIIRYHASVIWQEVLQLGIAAAIGVPVGIWALANVNESVVKTFLGLILVAYAIYSWTRPVVRRLPGRQWAWLAGFLSGCLSGAYNMPGPPLIVYSSLQEWSRNEFRAVLQTLFFISSVLTVGLHFIAQHVTVQVLTLYAFSAPALFMGVVVGARLDPRVNKELYRAMVTAMILILGVSLILGF